MHKYILLISLLVPIQIFANNNHIDCQVVQIIDGDTIKCDTNKIRLLGIDAPEKNQRCNDNQNKKYYCGKETINFLSSFMQNKAISCDIYGKDFFRRDLGICFADKININEKLLEEGLAISYLFNNHTKQYVIHYPALEEKSRQEKKGLWKGKFQSPKDYRKQKKKVMEGLK